jgi:hypothetical protein
MQSQLLSHVTHAGISSQPTNRSPKIFTIKAAEYPQPLCNEGYPITLVQEGDLCVFL